jgi:hypothetical protein
MASIGDDTVRCDRCDASFTRAEAIRTETIAGLDPATWQSLCCPTCGQRLKTVFVGDE